MPHYLYFATIWLPGISTKIRESIHDWNAFTLFLALGFLQIILAIYGGYLSAIPLDQRLRRKHMGYFLLLGVLLFLLTIRIGVVNDRNQFDSAQAAGKIQSKLDQSYITLIQTNGTISGIATVLIANEKHTPSGEQKSISIQTESILNELQKLKNNISQVLPPSLSENANPANRGTHSLYSALSDAQLRDEVLKFSQHLIGARTQILRLQEAEGMAELHLQDLSMQGKPAPQTAVGGEFEARKAYLDSMNAVAENDFPLAKEYRKELLGRLPRDIQIVEFQQPIANVYSATTFLSTAAEWLPKWANQLPALH